MVNQVKIIQKIALVYNNKVLVLKRSKTDTGRPGTWDFPGGNVDDEDVTQFTQDILMGAIIREVKEETGIDIQEDQITPTFFNSGKSFEKNMLVISTGYQANLKTEPQVTLSFEHDEYQWVTKEEFLNLDFGFAKETFLQHITSLDF